MNNISAVIVAKDNPLHIFESVESISTLVNEIIIIDIGIDSDIVHKLKKIKKVIVKKIDEEIKYVEIIREKSKSFAKYDYVLFLDPDEILPENLINLLQQEVENYDFFSIPRKNIIMGKWIEHSRWWPDYQVRLFKKDMVKWPIKIHSQPELSGNGYTVEEKEELAIIHYNYENLTEFFMKMIRYAESEAKEIITRGEKLNLSITIKNGLQEFISRYFADNGYQDGMHGFVLSFLQMMYAFIVYFYYWELKKYPPIENKEINESVLKFYSQGLYEISYWLEKNNIMKQNIIKKFIIKYIH